MKKMVLTCALAALAGVPAAAMQQGRATGPGVAQQPAVPRTVHSEMMVYQEPNFNGRYETLETPSSSVRTDWPIRSIAIHPGDRWQLCGRSRFRNCIILNRSIPDARLIGIENQIGSARLAPDTPAPAPGN